MHPVEPRAAGHLPPTVRPQGRRLSVVLTLAVNETEICMPSRRNGLEIAPQRLAFDRNARWDANRLAVAGRITQSNRR